MGISNPDNRIKKVTSSYLQYTGLAFQMAGIIAIAIFLGRKLDSYLQFEKPYGTAILSIVFLTGFLYKLYVDLMKKSK